MDLFIRAEGRARNTSVRPKANPDKYRSTERRGRFGRVCNDSKSGSEIVFLTTNGAGVRPFWKSGSEMHFAGIPGPENPGQEIRSEMS